MGTIVGNTRDIENETVLELEDDEQSDDSEGIINWDIDYGDQDSYSDVQFKTSMVLSGIHMMIINDQDNIFYPILQMNVE